jgi:hypothetical protein
MSKLIFQADDVRRVIEHTLAAKEQSPLPYSANEETPDGIPVKEPAVLLVHDDGVYLMSNGKPRDIDERHAGPSEKSYVAYARGCDPKKNEEWWDTSRDLVGGDDFGECLEWAREMKRMLDAGATQFVIDVTEQNLSLSAKYGRRQYATGRRS